MRTADPRVFISSTVEDLHACREMAKEAVIEARLQPTMQEYFVASGDHPPLHKCLAEVAQSQVVVAIVAHRYGWIPPAQPDRGRKSITWLECEQAVRDGHEVLAFVLDDKASWPGDQYEKYALHHAVADDSVTDAQLAALRKEVRERTDRLQEFKDWLNQRAIRATFATPEELRRKVALALVDWRQRQSRSDGSPMPPPDVEGDPQKYLGWLGDQTGYIDIRGLAVGKSAAHRFPIEELYMSLTTSAAASSASRRVARGKTAKRAKSASLAADLAPRSAVPLHEALRHDRLVIMGDPGAGKTTFVRRVAHALAQTRRGEVPDAAEARLGLTDRTFPLFIRLGDLAQHIRRCRKAQPAPATDDAPGWLPHFLAARSADNALGLEAEFFTRQLQAGLCTVLLDGLDEAPDRPTRERLGQLIEQATRAYGGCRFVITSRPAGYLEIPGFVQARIDPLSDDATRTFLHKWCEALYAANRASAAEHCDELLGALRARPEIRRMARNPVMLTALAVVHWNERRLPEQRADLYESIVRWLSRSREQREGREKAERTVFLLQELALALQDHPEGMQIAVPRRWAAEVLAPHWTKKKVNPQAVALADAFLEAEELDSGIVVARGGKLQFWHRTFQEFLAARALASRLDDEQRKRLWGPPVRVYQSEWREVILLLAGILHGHGPAKVDALLTQMLDALGPRAKLSERARTVGLLGAILHDLAPVDYAVSDSRYAELRQQVLAIFERSGSATVALDLRIEAADALGQAGDPRIEAGRRDYWAIIPAGRFRMGAQAEKPKQANYDPEASAHESPVHEVQLDAFAIARYPVTVGQFQQFIEHDGYAEPAYWSAGGGFGTFTQPEGWDGQQPYPTRPVVGVSWHEAAAFCAWLSDMLRRQVTLPTEAQWERAARGTEGRRYPWGEEPPDASRFNFAKEFGQPNVGHPTPVGIYPLGNTPDDPICDLAGNVWEWCADFYDEAYYKSSPGRNPKGPAQGDARVLRGGSWLGPADIARCACRGRFYPVFRNVDIGFRLVASPF